MTTFLDTNILISVLTPSDTFHAWAVSKLEECRTRGPTIISEIVYCEFSVAMATKEQTDTAISELSVELIRGSREALFRAGKAFLAYRRNNGPKSRVLADFIIGAAAAVAGAPLMTANPGDFVTYFPDIQLICP